MILRHLELENFLSHRKRSLAFPDSGIFLLSGESGAGKSSLIVDSVAYALFGAAATRAKRQADLVSRGAEEMSVRATFDFSDNRRIVFARGLDARGSSWAQVYQDGDILAEGSAPVGRYLRSELGGITWQQFYAAFVARQSEIALLTNLRGSERKNLVQRMLGMRELAKAEELLAEKTRRLSAEIEQLEKSGASAELLSEAENLQRHEDDLVKQESTLAEAVQQSAALSDRLESVSQDLAPLLASERLFLEQSELVAQKEALEERVFALQRAQKALEEAQASQEALPGAEQALTAAEEQRDRLLELYRRSEKYIQLLDEADNLRPKIDQSSQELGIDLEEWSAQIAALSERSRSALKRAEKLRLSLDDLGDNCPVCLRPFADGDDLEQSRQHIVLEAESLEQDARKARLEEIELRSLEGRLRSLEEQKTKLDLLQKRALELEEVGIEKDLDSLLERGQQARTIRQDKARDLETLRRKASLGQDADPEKLERLLQGLAEMPKTLPERPDQAELGKYRTEADSLQQQKAALDGKIQALREALEKTKIDLDRSSKIVSGREQEIQALRELQARSEILQGLKTYLKAYQKHLAHEIRPSLEEIGSEMIRRLSGGRHTAMHIDDEYEIEIEEASGKKLQSSMISGGESVRANLCLRLALTRLVSQRTGVPLGMLVLDEPLSSQDPGHVERILELLQSLRPFYPQQFIISHIGDLASVGEIDYLLDFDETPLELTRP